MLLLLRVFCSEWENLLLDIYANYILDPISQASLTTLVAF